MVKLTLLTLVAMQYLNTPYRYGANGPFQFDCSGLALKCLHDVGITLADMTAQDLYNWTLKQKSTSCEPQEDCLLFFGSSNMGISHVGIGISKTHMIEAGGAGSNTENMTDAELIHYAKNHDARVRIKPIMNRKDLQACVKLQY